MKYITTLLLTLILTSASAQFQSQGYVLKVKPVKYKDNYKAARSLNTIVREVLESDYQFSNTSSIELKPVINTGKAHLIEGMDVKTSGKPELEFHLIDKNTKDKDVFVYSEQLTARTTGDLADALVESFGANADKQSELVTFVKAFVDKVFTEHCQEYKENIQSLNAAKKYDESIKLLLNYTKSNCDPSAAGLLSKTLTEQSNDVCDTKMQKASVMVNSGVNFQMKRAIPILLSISPDAVCAGEAIQLAKVIGDKLGKTSTVAVELSQYQNFGNNRSGWETYYLQQLMSRK